jgi:hypothetical protein
VAMNELNAIKVAPSYKKVLIEQMRMTTCRELVLAERHVIIEAMKQAKVPRKPTLEQVAVWQDEARRYRPEQLATGEPWVRKADFVVSFQERSDPDRGWERRVEVAQAEVDPEPRADQLGWGCEWVCGWMRGSVGLDALAGEAVAPPAADVPSRDVEMPNRSAPGSSGLAVAVSSLAFGAVVLVDRDGRRHVDDSDGASRGVVSCSPPVHLTVDVLDAQMFDDLRLVVRVRTLGRRDTWTIYERAMPGGRRADVDLSTLSAGEHRLTVVARNQAGRTEPALLRLPALRIGPSTGSA